MQTECVAHNVELAIVSDFVDLRAVAKVIALELRAVFVQGPVCLHLMRVGVPLREVSAELFVGDQLFDFFLQPGWVACQVFQVLHGNGVWVFACDDGLAATDLC